MKKVLFFLKTPLPVTGATLMNERVCNSRYLRDSFDVEKIKISYAKSVDQLGTIDFDTLCTTPSPSQCTQHCLY